MNILLFGASGMVGDGCRQELRHDSLTVNERDRLSSSTYSTAGAYDCSTMAETAEMLCPKCGATAEAGLIFCQKCGAVLKPINPLIPSPTRDSDSIRIRTRSGKSIFLIFAMCAVIDFLLSYHDHRSVPFGVISAVGGLFGTAFYVFLFGAFDTHSK